MTLDLKQENARKKTAPEKAQKPPKLDLVLLLYQPLISHFKIDFLSEAAGFPVIFGPFLGGGVKSA